MPWTTLCDCVPDAVSPCDPGDMNDWCKRIPGEKEKASLGLVMWFIHLEVPQSGDLHGADRRPLKPSSDRTCPQRQFQRTGSDNHGGYTTIPSLQACCQFQQHFCKIAIYNKMILKKVQVNNNRCWLALCRFYNSQPLPDVIQPVSALQGRQPFVIRDGHWSGDIYKKKKGLFSFVFF